MTKINWDALEIEYITTKTTYRKLAEENKVARSSIEKYAKENNWTKKRSQYWGKIKANALARAGAREENRLLKLQTEAEKMVNVLETMIGDDKQFNRQIVTGTDPNGKPKLKEFVTDKFDSKSFKNATSALRELTAVMRDLYEIYPEDKKQRMKVERERLKIEKEKLKIAKENILPQETDGEYGIIEIEQVMEEPVGGEK